MYFNDRIIKKTNPKINIKEALSERTADLRLRHLERQYSFGNLVQDWLDEKRRVSVFFFVKDDEVWCKGFTWFINKWSSSFLNMHLTNKHIQKNLQISKRHLIEPKYEKFYIAFNSRYKDTPLQMHSRILITRTFKENCKRFELSGVETKGSETKNGKTVFTVFLLNSIHFNPIL